MLKDYIETARWHMRDAAGRIDGFIIRLPADFTTLRLAVVQEYESPRAAILLVITHFRYYPNSKLCSTYRGSHLKVPLPFSLDV